MRTCTITLATILIGINLTASAVTEVKSCNEKPKEFKIFPSKTDWSGTPTGDREDQYVNVVPNSDASELAVQFCNQQGCLDVANLNKKDMLELMPEKDAFKVSYALGSATAFASTYLNLRIIPSITKAWSINNSYRNLGVGAVLLGGGYLATSLIKKAFKQHKLFPVFNAIRESLSTKCFSDKLISLDSSDTAKAMAHIHVSQSKDKSYGKTVKLYKKNILSKGANPFLETPLTAQNESPREANDFDLEDENQGREFPSSVAGKTR